MKRIFLSIIATALSVAAFAATARQTLLSPDGNVKVNVCWTDGITYEIFVDGTQVLAPSAISLTLSDGTVFGGNSVLRKISRKSFTGTFKAQNYRKAEVEDNYNLLELTFKNYKLLFRAYNDGVAYRFVSLTGKPFEVKGEQADFTFPEAWNAWLPYVDQENPETFEEQFHNSFENTYNHISIGSWDARRLAFLPIMIDAPEGIKLCISESDLLNYPGMFLSNPDGDNTVSAVFPKYPAKRTAEVGDGRSIFVTETDDCIAKCEAGDVLPWRVIAISRHDWEMADNDMVYRLASAPDPAIDYSWVKPGKVAWDWWNDWNLYGVDFKTGVNNDTYKYYIDFASQYGIEYVIMDEGWSVGFEDLFHIVPEIDLEGIISYAKERNVGIILWAGYSPFQKDMEKACQVYSEMGVKGFKVDFMDGCDQVVVDFHRKAAETAAKYGLMVDFHGTYKPTGLHRTYPNVINFEGVHGLEQMKWDKTNDHQVVYDVTIPFIRFFAGPADYTQGAMRNATRENFHPVYNEPMSQGTRCHQLAEYVIFSSPLNMLCDSPSNYMAEPECTKYIAEIPEVWDETVALDGKVGEYIAIARRSGDKWYIGVLGDWTARDVELKLDFLPEDKYDVTIYQDGVNAERAARDYKKLQKPLDSLTLKAHLAPGGGYVAVISPEAGQ